METTYPGSRGPTVELVQLALQRAGAISAPPDGIFGPVTGAAVRAFQRAEGLVADGVAGPRTNAALRPYLTGYRRRTVRPGDTLWRIARQNGVPLSALAEANPEAAAERLQVGSELTVPFAFSVVSPLVHPTSEAAALWTEGLLARYPAALSREETGRSVLGKPIDALTFGAGPLRLFCCAAHHANETLPVTLLFCYAEACLRGRGRGGAVGGRPAAEILAGATLCFIPLVNPDGADLVCGAYPPGSAAYARAAAMSGGLPFPDAWKANLDGTDLNLQYPAGWERAREIKFAAGYTRPGPRDYVGPAPLTAPEARAVYEFTRRADFARAVAFHSQGRVIYWRWGETDPEGAEALGRRLARVSGYALAETPEGSAYAGYKDWFIKEYRRPGYTVEVGLGENPLPRSQFPDVWRAAAPLITEAAR